MTKTAEYVPHAADEPRKAARKFLRAMLGGGVWIAYGTCEIEGYVLSVGKHTAEIQAKSDGQIQTVAFAAITEMVEV
jgi:hypothetical protein